MNTNERVAWGWIIFFALFTFYQYFINDLKLFDYVMYIIVLSVALLVSKKLLLPTASVWFFGISTMAHNIGTIPFFLNGEEVSLYHSIFFNGNYDLFTHAFGLCFFTLGLLTFYMQNHEPSKFTILLLLLALIGAGTTIEMAEFAGYKLFGFGWGAFAFGEGDNSQNFGPWGDSMTDTYANVIGILAGFLLYFTIVARTRVAADGSTRRKVLS